MYSSLPIEEKWFCNISNLGELGGSVSHDAYSSYIANTIEITSN